MIGEDKPRELALMVIWQGGEVIVQERTHTSQGGLGFWGGKIKEGEEPFDAAVRETNEEIFIPKFKPERPKPKQIWEPIEHNGWRIHPYQAAIRVGTKYHAKEGKAEKIFPSDMWNDPRLMEASRAILRELIFIPNGVIDN